MKVLLLSDMHFKTDDNLNNGPQYAKEIASIVKDSINTNEKLLVLNLGDVVDQGNKEAFIKAKEFYDVLKHYLPDDTDYAFVPGNHDYCGDYGLLYFDEFIKEYSTIYCNYNFKSTFVLKYEEITFILSKSTLSRNNDKENVNLDDHGIREAIDDAGELINPVLVLHHGCLSKEKTDFIKGQDKLIELNKKYQFQCYIHGHEHSEEKEYLKNPHGINSISVGNCFKLVGATDPQFSVLDINCGYITQRNIYEKKYNNFEHCRIEKIQDVNYSEKHSIVNDYIARNVISLNDYENHIYWPDCKHPIDEMIVKNQRTIILGEAGSGKSYFVENFTAKEQHNNRRIQLLNCKKYCGERILDLISPELSKDINDLTLLFDGLDELDYQYKEKFLNELNKFWSTYKTKIIITSRLNEFKKINQTSNVFCDIPQYVLVDFELEDTKEYLNAKGIDAELFMDEISKKSLTTFHLKPFYLFHLSKYYDDYGYLPKQNEFFYEIIDKETAKTIDRLLSQSIVLGKNELKKSIYLIGFSFLCMGINSLSINDCKQLLDNFHLPMVIGNAIINVTDTDVSFFHNNFKEFCAAQFLLEFDRNEVLDLITNENQKIKYTWLNTLGFYVVNKLRSQNLINHIMKNDLLAITNIEIDKFNLEDLKSIYNNILQESIEDGVRVEHLVHDIKIFSNFINNEKDIYKLIDYIEKADNEVSLIDAFVLLSNKNNLFNTENQIFETVMNFFHESLETQQFKDYVFAEGINLLSNLRLCDNENKIFNLIELFKNTNSDHILHNLYRLVSRADYPEKYVDAILNIEINKRINEDISFGSHMYLSHYLLRINSFNAIMKFISVYSEEKFNLYDKEKILSAYLKIISANKEWIDASKLELFKIYIDRNCIHSINTKNILKTYFKDVKITKEVLDFLLSYKEGYYSYETLGLLDDESELYFCELYKTNKLNQKIDFIRYVKNMNHNSKNYCHFVNAIKDRGDYDELEDNYQKQILNEQNANQNHFNLMFCLEKYIQTFHLMFDKYISKEWTMKKFFNEYILKRSGSKSLSEDYYLRKCFYYDMQRFLKDENQLSDYDNYVLNNNDIFFGRIASISKNEKIVIIDEHINFFMNYCNDYVKNFLHQDIVSISDNRIPRRLIAFAELSCKYNFVYDEKYLKNLLLIPSYVYCQSEFGKLPHYITNNYNDSEIERTVCCLISNENVLIDVVCEFWDYLQTKNIDVGSTKAYQVLTDSNINQYLREHAFKYLLNINENEKWIDDLILDDRELLQIVYNNAVDVHENIINQYKRINENDTEHVDGLAELLQLQDTQGINMYLSYCKSKMKVPDYDDNPNAYPSITSKILHIDKIKFLKPLCDLLILKSSKDFRDLSDFGLGYYLSKALVNIAKNNYKIVVDSLKEIISNNSNNKELVQICSYIKLDIEQDHNYSIEAPISLLEVENLILN